MDGMQKIINKAKYDEIVTKCLVVDNKLMTEIYFKKPILTYNVNHILKKENKNLKKQEILDMFIEVNKKGSFSLIWFIIILKIYLETLPLVKVYVINHLI